MPQASAMVSLLCKKRQAGRTRNSASVRRRVMGLRPMRTVRASIILATVRFSSPPSLARWGASSL